MVQSYTGSGLTPKGNLWGFYFWEYGVNVLFSRVYMYNKHCWWCCLVAKSCPTLCDPMDYSPPAPLSVEFSRQDYWSGLPFPSPGDLPDPGIKPMSTALAGHILYHWAAREALEHGKTLRGGEKKADWLGTSEPKQQHGGKFLEFSFCLISPWLGAGEAHSSKKEKEGF